MFFFFSAECFQVEIYKSSTTPTMIVYHLQAGLFKEGLYTATNCVLPGAFITCGTLTPESME